MLRRETETSLDHVSYCHGKDVGELTKGVVPPKGEELMLLTVSLGVFIGLE